MTSSETGYEFGCRTRGLLDSVMQFLCCLVDLSTIKHVKNIKTAKVVVVYYSKVIQFAFEYLYVLIFRFRRSWWSFYLTSSTMDLNR